MKNQRRTWVEIVEMDLDLCNGCKMCVDVCFLDVIRWNAKEERPIAVYPEDCVWCLACEEVCPVQCIEVIPSIPAPLRASY